MTVPAATLVITTRNRRDDLRRAIESAVRQDVVLEILVIDDGSTDGTSEMVRDEFPQVCLERSERSLGLIVQRNRAAKLAIAPVIVSLDDDAEFSTPHVVSQALDDLKPSEIGAVAMPYINLRQDQRIRTRAPNSDGVYLTDSFTGTAHALHRDLFLQLGGYRETLFHQGEERDFCIRMLEAGYFTRLGNSDPIYHYESPRRDVRRMDLYGRRNDILFAWHNVPMPKLISHLAATTLRGISFGVRVGRPIRMLRGLTWGYAACLHQWSQRKPVQEDTYRRFRTLSKQEAVHNSEFCKAPVAA